MCHCADLCSATDGERFITDEVKRHHMAVLRKCQRCLSKNVGTMHDLDVKAISEAIDFLVDYCKLY
jgi:hypothetical protein